MTYRYGKDFRGWLKHTVRQWFPQLGGGLIIGTSRRDGHHVPQRAWNGPRGFEFKRGDRGPTGQEVGNLLGQGDQHICIMFVRPDANAPVRFFPVKVSNANSGADRPEQVVVHGI